MLVLKKLSNSWFEYSVTIKGARLPKTICRRIINHADSFSTSPTKEARYRVWITFVNFFTSYLLKLIMEINSAGRKNIPFLGTLQTKISYVA